MGEFLNYAFKNFWRIPAVSGSLFQVPLPAFLLASLFFLSFFAKFSSSSPPTSLDPMGQYGGYCGRFTAMLI